MPAPLKVDLTEQEDAKLLQLKQMLGIPQRIRDRAEMIRLNGYGWSVAKIVKYMKKSPHTVRASLHRWQQRGIDGLWEAPGRGRKSKWIEADLEFLEQCLQEDQRTYNSRQLSQKLAAERQVKLSGDRIRRLLKKRGSGGNAPASANLHSRTHSVN